MRPLNPDSPRLQLRDLDRVDGIKDELAQVARATGVPPSEIAVRILMYCRGRYAQIVERTPPPVKSGDPTNNGGRRAAPASP